ncbi:MAG TPA: FG-GAP-like repeat-containing protein [Bryobacteraceae bacterium]|nr:FG-GAP-like repeat-containing protein [Bryobacteraceae bacterium]
MANRVIAPQGQHKIMTRRELLATLTAAACWHPRRALAAPFPVHFRKPSPHELLAPYIQPGADAFPGEKVAMEIAAELRRLAASGALPLPTRHRPVSPDVFEADVSTASPQPVQSIRFYVLPLDTIRYEIQNTQPTGVEYRVGHLHYQWKDGKFAELRPVRETMARVPHPLFRDVTAELFGASDTFREQLLRGIPYWRARLDSASGIDIYGNQGIAVGDFDDDGQDEVYVCQPGGLPNRLYRMRDGHMQDITDHAGVGLLDDTSSALFLDLRNIGRQDLVVLRASGPVLFLNQGDGTFALRRDAFQFRAPIQGSFTGMSAADYDRDGRVDLYLCTYTYFQSEDQYRYPVPYHDAQNGPPNYLFRNQLKADGSGVFEDVTASTGLDQNNNRFSFAPAWCDFDGDGWPDLYVANDFGQHNLYKNTQGRFHDIAAEAYVEDMGPGMSASWFDFDDDGRPDLYVSNMWSEAGQRVVREAAFRPVSEGGLREPYRRHTKGNSLYQNRGDGTFADASEGQGVEMGRWAWSSGGFDFDNDRSPEIFVTCGMLTGPNETDLMSFFWRQVVAKSPISAGERSEAYENGWNAINQLIREDYSWNGREPNVFYARRNGAYHDLSGVSGLDCALDSRAFAVTDLDGDGNLDILLKSRLGPQVKAFQNDCAGGRKAIGIRLVGTRSNRDAIGARVEVDGRMQFVQAGSGYVSQHTKVLYFGLGGSDLANLVRVQWPTGAHQEFRALTAGYLYEITEGSVGLRRQAFRGAAHKQTIPPPQGDNQTRSHDTWLLEAVPLPDKRKGPGLLYIGEGESPNVPAEVVNLRKESPDVAAGYALFRRYLLDWRTALVLPLVLLIDEQSRVHKLYANVPDAATLGADLKLMRDGNRRDLALPFHGDYLNLARRNYFKLGAAFYWAGYPDLALPYLEETVRQSPENDKALNAIGQIHLDAGRFEAARPYLQKAVAVNPRLGEAWNNLGGVDSGSGKLPAALANYQRAIDLLPKAAYPLVNAGEVQAELGDTAAATKLFQRAMEVDPSDAEAPNQLGMMAARANRNAEAKDWFQKAIALKRDHAGAINNLGVLYLQMGQTNDAVAAFEYGIKMVPKDELMYMNLGRTYIKMGDRTKARETMLRLLEEKPDSAAAVKALRELENR